MKKVELIGQRLKRIRIKTGLSQKDMAEKINVRRETISRWERGSHIPQSICLIKLREVLDNLENLIEMSNIL